MASFESGKTGQKTEKSLLTLEHKARPNTVFYAPFHGRTLQKPGLNIPEHTHTHQRAGEPHTDPM